MTNSIQEAYENVKDKANSQACNHTVRGNIAQSSNTKSATYEPLEINCYRMQTSTQLFQNLAMSQHLIMIVAHSVQSLTVYFAPVIMFWAVQHLAMHMYTDLTFVL